MIQFRINKNTPLRKLMSSYSEHIGHPESTLRFTFDGNQLEKDQTPSEVHVHVQLTYGTLCMRVHQSSPQRFPITGRVGVVWVWSTPTSKDFKPTSKDFSMVKQGGPPCFPAL